MFLHDVEFKKTDIKRELETEEEDDYCTRYQHLIHDCYILALFVSM